MKNSFIIKISPNVLLYIILGAIQRAKHVEWHGTLKKKLKKFQNSSSKAEKFSAIFPKNKQGPKWLILVWFKSNK